MSAHSALFIPASGKILLLHPPEYCCRQWCIIESHKVKEADVAKIALPDKEEELDKWKQYGVQFKGIELLALDIRTEASETEVSNFTHILKTFGSRLQLLNTGIRSGFTFSIQSLPELRQITTSFLDDKSFNILLQSSPYLTTIRCGRSNFNDWQNVPAGVEVLIDAYCSLQVIFFQDEAVKGKEKRSKSVKDLMLSTKVLYICGSEDEMIQQKKNDQRWSYGAGIVIFPTFRIFKSYANREREIRKDPKKRPSSHPANSLYEIANISNQDIQEILLYMGGNLEELRIANAAITKTGLMKLRKAHKLKVLVISLMPGMKLLSIQEVKTFVELSFDKKTLRMFEVYDRFRIEKEMRERLQKLETKLGIRIFAFHHFCSEWSALKYWQADVTVDGLMFRKGTDARRDTRLRIGDASSIGQMLSQLPPEPEQNIQNVAAASKSQPRGFRKLDSDSEDTPEHSSEELPDIAVEAIAAARRAATVPPVDEHGYAIAKPFRSPSPSPPPLPPRNRPVAESPDEHLYEEIDPESVKPNKYPKTPPARNAKARPLPDVPAADSEAEKLDSNPYATIPDQTAPGPSTVPKQTADPAAGSAVNERPGGQELASLPQPVSQAQALDALQRSRQFFRHLLSLLPSIACGMSCSKD